MLKIKPKLKEASRKILEHSFNILEGTGIGKIPGVFKMFISIESLLFNTVVEVDGQKFHLDVSGGLRTTWNLYYKRIHEPQVTSIFCSLINGGATVVDVGASIGYYTLLAAKRVGEDGFVYAFEPHPPSFERLIENVKLNDWKNVQAFNFAISDKKGKKKLYVFKSGRASGSGFALRNDSVPITVKTMPLEDAVKTDIDLVKMDIEGAEVEVLKGMERTLAKGKVKIICEVHPKHISLLGHDVSEITELLKKHSYKIYLIDEEGGGGLVSMSRVSEQKAHYLFTREEI